MEIGHGQQLGFAFGEPLPRRRALALRAMTIAAGIVGDVQVGTRLATRDMSTARGRAAGLDRRHHLELAEAEMACLGFAPGRTMVAEDIRDLQSWTSHAP